MCMHVLTLSLVLSCLHCSRTQPPRSRVASALHAPRLSTPLSLSLPPLSVSLPTRVPPLPFPTPPPSLSREHAPSSPRPSQSFLRLLLPFAFLPPFPLPAHR